MTAPIHRMIDAVVRCTICGAAMGKCDCWDKDHITLRCPKCKRTKSAARDKTDLPGTSIVECICNKCDKGDRSEILYFDSSGKQIQGKYPELVK